MFLGSPEASVAQPFHCLEQTGGSRRLVIPSQPFPLENKRVFACCFNLDPVSTLPSELHPPKPMVSVLPHSSGGDTRPAPRPAPPEKTPEPATAGKPCLPCREGLCPCVSGAPGAWQARAAPASAVCGLQPMGGGPGRGGAERKERPGQSAHSGSVAAETGQALSRALTPPLPLPAAAWDVTPPLPHHPGAAFREGLVLPASWAPNSGPPHPASCLAQQLAGFSRGPTNLMPPRTELMQKTSAPRWRLTVTTALLCIHTSQLYKKYLYKTCIAVRGKLSLSHRLPDKQTIDRWWLHVSRLGTDALCIGWVSSSCAPPFCLLALSARGGGGALNVEVPSSPPESSPGRISSS